MFNSVKKLWQKESSDSAEYDAQADEIARQLALLEGRLAQAPGDGETQKQLLIHYNQAIKVFAKSKRHRDKIDPLFIKMDELRNIIRTNI